MQKYSAEFMNFVYFLTLALGFQGLAMAQLISMVSMVTLDSYLIGECKQHLMTNKKLHLLYFLKMILCYVFLHTFCN